jgi:hypothetical protein
VPETVSHAIVSHWHRSQANRPVGLVQVGDWAVKHVECNNSSRSVGIQLGGPRSVARPYPPRPQTSLDARRRRSTVSRTLRGNRVARYCNYRPIEWCVAAVVLLCSVFPARSEYRLDAEDVLEISVAGVPELKQRVTVGADGTISFPLLGVVTVAGLLPSEARSTIQSNLATKIFRQRAADGRETVAVIELDQVTVSVAQFRPAFVNGDVSKPGQVPICAASMKRNGPNI